MLTDCWLGECVEWCLRRLSDVDYRHHLLHVHLPRASSPIHDKKKKEDYLHRHKISAEYHLLQRAPSQRWHYRRGRPVARCRIAKEALGYSRKATWAVRSSKGRGERKAKQKEAVSLYRIDRATRVSRLRQCWVASWRKSREKVYRNRSSNRDLFFVARRRQRLPRHFEMCLQWAASGRPFGLGSGQAWGKLGSFGCCGWLEVACKTIAVSMSHSQFHRVKAYTYTYVHGLICRTSV